ncbi:hypothetical protein [Nocardioides sp.]|uniref:hypothetical protein n=1 Tax=Nocardioides sp. TaxID=35761 RepID=UPI002735B23D|nr:hypothetical protein [Nocardioides sp.]MDP3889614.1 hypothetical protein [Nocardioides sp.]
MTTPSPSRKRKHLLSDQQRAAHAGATVADLAHGHRHGNGLRVHRNYIVIVSVMTLLLLVVAISLAGTR